MQDGKHQIGHFFLGIVVLTWGINFGIVKSAYQDISPVLFAAIRFTLTVTRHSSNLFQLIGSLLSRNCMLKLLLDA